MHFTSRILDKSIHIRLFLEVLVRVLRYAVWFVLQGSEQDCQVTQSVVSREAGLALLRIAECIIGNLDILITNILGTCADPVAIHRWDLSSHSWDLLRFWHASQVALCRHIQRVQNLPD